MLITENGGISWEESLLSDNGIYAIEMLNPEDGWCGGEKGVLYHYTDKTVQVREAKTTTIRQRRADRGNKYTTLLNGQRVNAGGKKQPRWRRIVFNKE